MTFQELAKLQAEILSKQPPTTIEEAREQVLKIKVWSEKFPNNEQDIKYHLKKYHPDWTENEIENDYQRLIKTYKK